MGATRSLTTTIPAPDFENIRHIPERRRRGTRPTKYNEPVVKELCKRLMLKESLTEICDDPHMPSLDTITNWLDADDRHEFQERYYNARRIQAELRVDEIFTIADDDREDYRAVEDQNGKVRTLLVHENVNRSKLKIDTRKWFAMKMMPKIYGEYNVQDVNIRGDLSILIEGATNNDKGLPCAIDITPKPKRVASK